MGNGSRGGNGGLSSSGMRQRKDKDEKKAAQQGRRSKGSSGRRRRRLHPNPNGHGGGLLHGLGGNKKGNATAGKKAAVKQPPKNSSQSKIPTIKRVSTPKFKLTKQRTNKAPN